MPEIYKDSPQSLENNNNRLRTTSSKDHTLTPKHIL